MSAGPWACVVGEPVIVPWSVHPMVPAGLDPLFITSYPVHLRAPKEAHTCVHLLNAGTIPRFFDLSMFHSCRLILFSLQLSVSNVLSTDFPTCRGIVVVFVRALLFSE